MTPEGWPGFEKLRDEHESVCAGLEGRLLDVARFHGPRVGNYGVTCTGCEDHLRDDCVVEWPCATWDLVIGIPVRKRSWGSLDE